MSLICIYEYKCIHICVYDYILLYVGVCIYLFVLLYELSMSSTCLVVTQMRLDLQYLICQKKIFLTSFCGIGFFCQQGIYVKIAETWAGGM